MYPPPETSTAPKRKRRGAAAVAASVGIHLTIVAAVLALQISPRRMIAEPPAFNAALIRASRPVPTPDPLSAPNSGRAAALRKHVTPPLQTPVETLVAGKALTPSSELSDAELVGAATTGSGSGGGAGCDMIRRLQAALRKDALVQAAVQAPAASGKALKVWDGDWVQSGGQDGRGLAAVREAILWEVGFSPAACKAEPMHGLVLLSLNDGPGATRLAVGAGEWRWSDLLTPRRAH